MKILVVEDKPEHMRDALNVLHSAGIDTVTASTSNDALRALNTSTFDGVITDIFMPHANQGPWMHSDDPCGLSVALAAEEKKIPFVMCTAGYHHGARYDWICQLGRRRGWPEIVDASGDYHSEADKKDWPKALKRLLDLIAKQKAVV